MTLFLVSVAFVVLLIWAQRQLDAANQQRIQYQSIKETASLGVVAKLQNYLLQGDATLLIEAEEQLLELQAQLEILPTEAATPVDQQIQLLLEKAQSDYRALGKLSGDPMALLKIAEREMMDQARALLRYAADGHENSPVNASQYTNLGADVSGLVYQLGQARVQLFNGHMEAERHINALLSQLTDNVRAMQSLELLGLYTEVEVDEFALGDDEEEAEEKGELIIAELASLTRRYPSELDRTRKMASQRSQSFAMLEQDLETFRARIAVGEELVAEVRDQVLGQIKVAAGIMVGVLLLLTMTNYGMQFSFVLQPLRQLREAFHQLVETNELTSITVRNQKSELGEIATYFNQLIEHEQEEMKQREKQLQVISESLGQISDQVDVISRSNQESEQLLLNSRQNTDALSEITKELSRISAVVETNAKDTEQAMSHSLSEVNKVIVASEETAQAAESGSESLANLTNSVGDVSAILDVIRVIAEQTNLLALNAAIESARAGEHGRGFAVVADEVRQLALKTQTSLEEITGILSTLDSASSNLEESILQVQKASGHQKEIAEQLLTTSGKVREQSQQAVGVTHQAFSFVKEQEDQVGSFIDAMDVVQRQVEQARGLATNIQVDVQNQAARITGTLQQGQAA